MGASKISHFGSLFDSRKGLGIYSVPDEASMWKVQRIRVPTYDRWKRKIVAKRPAADLKPNKQMLQIVPTRCSALSAPGYASTPYIRKFILGDYITRDSVASGGVREPLFFLSGYQRITRRRISVEFFRKYFTFISIGYKAIWRPQGEATLSPSYECLRKWLQFCDISKSYRPYPDSCPILTPTKIGYIG